MPEPVYGFSSKDIRDKLAAFARTLAEPFRNILENVVAPEQQTRTFKATVKTKVTASGGGKAGHNYKVGTGEVYLLRLEALQLKWWFHPGTTRKLERTVFNACPVIYDVDENSILTIIQDRAGDFWVEKVCETGSFSSSISSSVSSSLSSSSPSSESSSSSLSSSSSPSSSSSLSSTISSSPSSSILCECIWLWSAFSGPVGTEFWSIDVDNCDQCQQTCDPNSIPGFDGTFDGETFPGVCIDPPASSVSQASSVSESLISSNCFCTWEWVQVGEPGENDWEIFDTTCPECLPPASCQGKPTFDGSFLGETFPGVCVPD